MVDLIWQYRKKPKAKATAKLLSSIVYDSFDECLEVANILNIEKASGYALDLIGLHVGVKREQKDLILKEFFGFNEATKKQGFGEGEFYRLHSPLYGNFLLSDYEYRFMIKAKIIKNYQTGTLENFYQSLKFLFGEDNFAYDNYDMTMNIVIKERVTPFLLELVLKNKAFIRPIGVNLKLIVIADKNTFGFVQNKKNKGFGVGKFARIYKEKKWQA
ncbi:DUF2612 domain-containing protein [Campylobacter ureolyticus]|uniref:DUF2612 domain-containing protein n=1 Tax=Campylobacter ureolyticus TaxID=827 RepID=UPI0022B48585|nr:DUF2612 domain-containing protein [Campylobacter ureolyticus]MCZ6172417.1 DUF2612 domain-containing protein [Campylobacter ureolyticus]